MNGRNKTHENKTNHRLFEMNKNHYLSWYFWEPELDLMTWRVLPSLLLWKTILESLCCLSRATEEPVFMSQDCLVLSTRCHAGFDEWSVEVCWFLSLTLLQECNPETSCTMVGNLAKISMFIIVLTYANSLACVFTTCAGCVPPYCLKFMGDFFFFSSYEIKISRKY